MAETLGQELETMTQLNSQLYESMNELSSKMESAKASKDQLVARARLAKTANDVNDMLAGIGGSSMAAFESMAEKVEQLEAQAEITKELAESNPNRFALPGTSGSG